MRNAMFGAAISMVSVTGWAQLAPSPEAWLTTNLDLAFSKTFIANDKCRANDKFFESCERAIKAASVLLKVPQEPFFPVDYDFEAKLTAMAESLPADISKQHLLGTALNAQVKALDTHAYLRPAQDPLVTREKAYVGTGFVARKSESGFFVVDVFENSPAKLAGMGYGDRVVAVAQEGQSMRSIAEENVLSLQKELHGQRGTVVHLEVARANGSREVLKLTRDNLQPQIMEYSSFPQDPELGYIRLRRFIPNQACNGVREALHVLSLRGVKKFILDLRGNPGGKLHEALCINSVFIGLRQQIGVLNVPIMFPRPDLVNPFDNATEIKWYTGFNSRPVPTKLAVLIDDHSASASEIVAGILQYYKAAWIVGERSAGKGSVQNVEPISERPSLVIGVTTSLYYFPNKLSNQIVGINPSFPVPSVAGQVEKNVPPEREINLHPDALPAVNEAWEDDRQEEIFKIKGCISERGLDLHYLNRLGAPFGDYQRAYAAAVLNCAP